MSWFDDNAPDSAGGAASGAAGGAPLPPGSGPGGGAGGTGNPTDPAYVRAQLAAYFQSQGMTPTGPGSGVTDIDYWTQKVIDNGGWTTQNAKGENPIAWVQQRIPQEVAQAGGGGGGMSGGMGGGSPYGTLGGGTTPLSDLAAGPNPLSDLATQAATGLTSSPGYQFRLQQGMDALQRSAAAKGTLLTGGTAKALDRYSQDYASNEYANRFNQLMGIQGTRYNQLLGEQGQRANQLLGLSQIGLNAAGQQANLGSTYAGQAGNLLGGQAGNITNALTGIGNAQAAGTVGAANAWAQGLGGAANSATNTAQMYYLSQLLKGTPPYAPAGTTNPLNPTGIDYGSQTTLPAFPAGGSAAGGFWVPGNYGK